MITVVGGAGFIGTRLCQRLADRQIAFEIVDLKPSKRFPEKSKIADIRDFEALFSVIEGSAIINLAAVHRDDVRDKSIYYSTNVEGTRNICRLADERGIKSIVFTSTVAVYGFADPETDVDGEIQPFNDYGKSKFEAEEVLRTWFETASTEKSLAIVRPTVVFGEGNRGNVYNLLNQINSGRFLMVGNGKNRKSMAYVGNIAAYLEGVATQGAGYKLVNYVDKPDFDMNTLVSNVRRILKGSKNVGPRLPYWFGLGLGYLADLFAKLTGKHLPISSIRVKKFCSTTAFASSVADETDFVPPYTLEEGLKRTLEADFLYPDPKQEVFYTE